MSLIFVHGRRQGDRSSQTIRESWSSALRSGLERAGLAADRMPSAFVPFYGARLDELTEAGTDRSRYDVVFRGRAEDEEFAAFSREVLDRIAQNANLSTEDVQREYRQPVVDRGVLNLEWTQAVVRAVSGRVPWLTEQTISTFVNDVWAYLSRLNVRRIVDGIVSSEIPTEPCVVVAHSLGSVVAYNVLSANTNLDVRLFLTAGSPLGVNAIRDRVHHPLDVPGCVDKWINVADEADVVALHSRLDRNSFAAGIENLSDVDNRGEPHSIERYLEDPEVAKRVFAASTDLT